MMTHHVDAFGPVFTFSPGRPDTNILLAAPHGGRLYPPSLTDRLRVPAAKLMRLEDRYADLLLRDASDRGLATLTAHAPRAIIDLNRSLQDFDFAMVEPGEAAQIHAVGIKKGHVVSARVRGGLGLVPRRLAHCGELWTGPFAAKDIIGRINKVHEPYHREIETALGQMAARHGEAILLDVHSMPPLSAERHRPAADIVIGDLHGTSAAADIVDRIAAVAVDYGLTVARNSPYAGGYVLRRHGRPRQAHHAVQLEIDRRLYLDSPMREPGPGLQHLSAMVADMAQAVMRRSDDSILPEAAE